MLQPRCSSDYALQWKLAESDWLVSLPFYAFREVCFTIAIERGYTSYCTSTFAKTYIFLYCFYSLWLKIPAWILPKELRFSMVFLPTQTSDEKTLQKCPQISRLVLVKSTATIFFKKNIHEIETFGCIIWDSCNTVLFWYSPFLDLMGPQQKKLKETDLFESEILSTKMSLYDLCENEKLDTLADFSLLTWNIPSFFLSYTMIELGLTFSCTICASNILSRHHFWCFIDKTF